MQVYLFFLFLLKKHRKVKIGNEQDKAQLERDSHSKNRDEKNKITNQVLIP